MGNCISGAARDGTLRRSWRTDFWSYRSFGNGARSRSKCQAENGLGKQKDKRIISEEVSRRGWKETDFGAPGTLTSAPCPGELYGGRNPPAGHVRWPEFSGAFFSQNFFISLR